MDILRRHDIEDDSFKRSLTIIDICTLPLSMPSLSHCVCEFCDYLLPYAYGLSLLCPGGIVCRPSVPVVVISRTIRVGIVVATIPVGVVIRIVVGGRVGRRRIVARAIVITLVVGA